VVLAPVAGVKLAEERQPNRVSTSFNPPGDGGKTNSSPGRARYKPSNHCAGNAGLLRLYLYARVRSLRTYCTRDRGCSKHPAFPCALSSLGGLVINSSGASRREITEACLRRMGGAQRYPSMPMRTAMGIASLHPSSCFPCAIAHKAGTDAVKSQLRTIRNKSLLQVSGDCGFDCQL